MKKMFEKARNEVLDWTLGILLGATPLYGYHVLSQKDANTNEGSAQMQKIEYHKPVEFVVVQPRENAGRLEEKVEKDTPQAERTKAQKIDYRTADFSKDSDTVLLARMLYGEARNCSKEEKIAIAYTALNRIHDGINWNGKTLRGVLLNHWQYSCFINYSVDNINKTEDKKLKEIKRNINLNRQRLMNPAKEEFAECLDAASGVLSGKYSDSTNGATHYHTSEIRPDWAGKMSNRKMPANFRHLFYREN